jgi:hypothetical protein
VNRKPHKALFTSFIFHLAMLFVGSPVHAYKIEVVGGGYSFTATNKRNNTTKGISGFGSYRIGMQLPFFNQFAVDAGYSLLATNGVSGDLAFGFDLGVLYFPLTPVDEINVQTDSVNANFQSMWRPFVGIAFHQRNFQSTSSQYAGTGLRLGVEMQTTRTISITGSIRYMQLGGPNESQASQLDVLAGALFGF